ncbi:MAG TPA: RDD family protein [Anaerolineales bacterium]|nr:RDD family protein [Anaerolineales bacterium]HLF02245.1 RDD family protein [Anaerolineales bacterium]
MVGVTMSNSLPDDYVSIDTPENVAFGYKVAGIGSRFLAALVDTIIIAVLQIVVLLTLWLIFLAASDIGWIRRGVAGDNGGGGDDTALFAWVLAFFGLIAFAFFWGYYILFEMIWNGQSIGKRWLGLRVIKTDGTPITLTESIVRNLIRLVDFLPAYYGVGVVTMFINDQSRRLGDLAAGTLVVHDRGAVTLESLAVKPAAPSVLHSASAAVATFPVERLNTREIQIAEDFLRRKNELHNRTVLGGRILQSLLDSMGLPASAVSGDWLLREDLIAAIVKAHHDRNAAPPTSNLQPPTSNL